MSWPTAVSLLAPSSSGSRPAAQRPIYLANPTSASATSSIAISIASATSSSASFASSSTSDASPHATTSSPGTSSPPSSSPQPGYGSGFMSPRPSRSQPRSKQ